MVFTKKDFDTFNIPTLEARMKCIRALIQPKFKKIGDDLVDFLQEKTDLSLHLHIAQHLRRSVNPPKDTWLAIANNKRGYKQHPHFQLGLFDDHVFIWLAYIYELPNKKHISKVLLDNLEYLQNLPNKYVISQNHMEKSAQQINKVDLRTAIKKFHDVKKCEFLIGVKIPSSNNILLDENKFLLEVKRIYSKLLPIYLATINV